MAWLLLSLRRLRDARVAALGLALLVLVTAFVFGLAPRLLDRMADEALQSEVGAASAVARNVAFVEERRITAGTDDPMEPVADVGSSLEAQLPTSVRSLVVDRSHVTDTPRWRVASEGREPGFIRLRIQQGVEEQLRYVDGRPPTAMSRTIPNPLATPDAGTSAGSAADTETTVLEASFSTAAADRVGLAVGDLLVLRADPTDPAVRARPVAPIAIDVVGLFDVAEPESSFWYDDRSLERPAIRSLTPTDILLDSVALLSPDADPALMGATAASDLPMRYAWRNYVDAGLLDAGQARSTATDLRRTESILAASGTGAGATGAVLQTGLRQLLETHLIRWSSAEGLLLAVAIGAGAVALAALALVTMLLAQRRQPALALSRGRGASRWQVVGALLAEGTVLAVPATVLAVAAAIAIVPDGPDLATVVAAATVAAVAVALLVTTVLPGTATIRHGGGPAPPTSGPRTRRLALEGAIVILAATGVFLVRSRGAVTVAGDAVAASEPPSIDLLGAAVPALVGIAAGLIAVRLLPWPMRLLERFVAMRPGLVPVLAVQRAARGRSAPVVLLVLMATVAIGTFASASLVHLDRAAEAVAWQNVGAPFRISGRGQPLPLLLDSIDLPGVEATARGYAAGATVATNGMGADLLALDVEDFREVAAGTPAQVELPPELIGPPTSPVSAIVSTGLTRGPAGVSVGDTIEVVVSGNRRRFRVAEVRDRFPSIPIGDDFVVISRAQYQAAVPEAPTSPRELYLRAPDDAVDGLRDEISVLAPGAAVLSRAEQTADLREAPVVRSLTTGIAIAALMAGLYAALAIAAALALSGSARALEAAHLRVFGLSRRQEVVLVALEHVPTVLLALVGGLLLGLAGFVILRPGLGFAEVIGSPLEIPLSVEPAHLGLLGLAVAVVVGGAIGVAAVLQRTAGLADAIRRGIE
jgi:putative ABC transport system permease protein